MGEAVKEVARWFCAETNLSGPVESLELAVLSGLVLLPTSGSPVRLEKRVLRYDDQGKLPSREIAMVVCGRLLRLRGADDSEYARVALMHALEVQTGGSGTAYRRVGS